MEQELLDIRKSIFLGAYAAGIGHVASSMSLVEILYTLYKRGIIKYDARNPAWEERDRVILSKGHGSLALYSVLGICGYFEKEEILKFGTVNSILGGEPILGVTPGVEASTGSLGHGLSIGIGMALALRADGKENRVFVILGDGECQEGSIWEGIITASRFCLSNLIVIIDDNEIQKMGRTISISGIVNLQQRWENFGWKTYKVNGHDVDEMTDVFNSLLYVKGPKAIFAKTVKGKGISCMENRVDYHYRMPGKKERKTIMHELNITEEELQYAKSIHQQNL